MFEADDAFSLKPYMLKPYPAVNSKDQMKLVYNYSILQARPVIETSFGNLAKRFQIFRRPIIAIVKTVCNIIRHSSSSQFPDINKTR